jgi:hypothetical protein
MLANIHSGKSLCFFYLPKTRDSPSAQTTVREPLHSLVDYDIQIRGPGGTTSLHTLTHTLNTHIYSTYTWTYHTHVQVHTYNVIHIYTVHTYICCIILYTQNTHKYQYYNWYVHMYTCTHQYISIHTSSMHTAQTTHCNRVQNNFIHSEFLLICCHFICQTLRPPSILCMN